MLNRLWHFCEGTESPEMPSPHWKPIVTSGTMDKQSCKLIINDNLVFTARKNVNDDLCELCNAQKC